MSEKKESPFLELLKKVCSKCTMVTLKVYFQGVKRLYRLLEPEATTIPTSKTWLMSEQLFEKYKRIAVNIRRHLSTAAFKATQAFGIKPENKWYAAMIQDQSKYQKQRDKNEPSDKEKALIPKAGIKAIQRSAVELKKRLKYVFSSPPSHAGLYQIQMWLAIKLLGEIPFRNDFPTIHLSEKKEHNFLKKTNKGYTIVMKHYKNSDRLGEREIKVSRAGSMAIKKILTYRSKLDLDHDMLFSTKGGDPLSKGAFGKALQSTTEKLLGKRIGTRIIRILFASKHKETIEEAAEITNKLLHTANQTKQYIRKKD